MHYSIEKHLWPPLYVRCGVLVTRSGTVPASFGLRSDNGKRSVFIAKQRRRFQILSTESPNGPPQWAYTRNFQQGGRHCRLQARQRASRLVDFILRGP